MNSISDVIKKRRSVRTYDGRTLDETIKEQILTYADGIENPWGIPVPFKLLDAGEHGLVCPVVSGTDLYVGGKVKNIPGASAAFGYSFEKFVLYVHSLGLGTVWLGGTMNRGAFEQAMELADDEMMPCATPIGYPASAMSMREKMMRIGVKADQRKPFEELFFDGTPDCPLTKERAGILAEPLEMVRLAPSAVNKQPWRVIAADGCVHFYLKRSKASAPAGRLDMQMVDMGIALCHFALAAEEKGLQPEFLQEDPKLADGRELEYVGSYKVNFL